MIYNIKKRIIPKVGDKFNALLHNGTIACGCPCLCTKLAKKNLMISAIDSDGNKRFFWKYTFTFEILKGD